MKNFFVFLTAVALILPTATAYNCTKLKGENKKICNYIESTDWSQSEKDSLIKNIINSGGASLDGNFISIMNKPIEDSIQLNKPEDADFEISDENKKFLIDFFSISLFVCVVYSFFKKHYLLKLI